MAEILAPVGSQDMLLAAVRCGADAVYLGLSDFNARRNAANFDETALREAVRYCHAQNVAVYLTMNTILKQEELPAAMGAISLACELAVEGVIVQDLGLASLIHRAAPQLPLHASTQMSVHTVAGVRLLEELGFSRVVLARELSLEEIRDIASNTSIELEVFVHGAQCMSVSGQCYLSSLLGQRSGNRGLCAQPCRLPFSVPGGTGHDLSLKDLSVLEYLPALERAGVISFKIEGRMKRPEYVAAAVTTCRQSLAGEISLQTAGQLRAVFSRSGFTDGYYRGVRGRKMFGIRQQEDVQSAKEVLSELSQLYRKETGRIPVSLFLTAQEGEPACLRVEGAGHWTEVCSTTPCERAQRLPATAELVEKQLSKCGGTPFLPQMVGSRLGDGVSLPSSLLNRLRREGLESLSQAMAYRAPIPFHPASPLPPAKGSQTEPPALWVRLRRWSQLPAAFPSSPDRVILPLEEFVTEGKQSSLPPERWMVELPRGMFGQEDEVRHLLEQARDLGVRAVLANQLDGVALARDMGFDVTAGYGCNVINREGAALLASLGVQSLLLSFEMSLQELRREGWSLPVGLIRYGHLPLMLTRNCPLANGRGCGGCAGGSLTDRKGIAFPVDCRMGCSEVYNSRPLYYADRKVEMAGADFGLLYFTTENRSEVERILREDQEGRESALPFTRGLYDKKLM